MANVYNHLNVQLENIMIKVRVLQPVRNASTLVQTALAKTTMIALYVAKLEEVKSKSPSLEHVLAQS
jgi:hypothetical protein